MGEKMPKKRLRNLGTIGVLTVALSVLFACLNSSRLDGLLAYLVIDITALAVLLYVLENNRLHQKIGNNISSDFDSITICYIILSALTAFFYFFPSFVFPAAFFALFLSVVSNVEIATGFGSLLCTILCIATGGNFYELAAYILLTIMGAHMAKTMHDKEKRRWGCMILFAVTLMIPMMFYYLSYSEGRIQILCWNAILSACGIGLYQIFATRLYDKTDFEAVDAIEKIVREDFPLVLDIKNYSKAEYVHAMKVSTIARKCAAEIGANELVSAAAGFYYRLGILEGEPFVENGVRLAREKSFPESIIQILSEYNGELQLPSSRESAIVHMVDACLKKIEMLSGHNLSTSWNQDMVIYQALNEISATGIYDESGLSMNQFLKLRELLVREEIGYDNYD